MTPSGLPLQASAAAGGRVLSGAAPVAAAAALTLSDITGLVLAGGRGMRMGGIDKGLQPLNGVPLVQLAMQRLAGQHAGVLAGVVVNANRNIDTYLALGETTFGAGRVQVVADRETDFSGPLAGFQAGLDVCSTPLMLTVPCDSPFFPLDLAHRLLVALLHTGADLAVAVAPEKGRDGLVALRSQPVFCLMRTTLAPRLHDYLLSGGRKVDAWAASVQRVQVAFNAPGDDPRAFTNTNTLDELRQLEG
ncbi:MAG: molybdenum cofactor guanylyltransferase MobA [Rhodoferax sp.]|uniref:molybdenum cofactor guanylyltransferase MobA n=1 Tax=Rhodoferax sp. TaxID=50421 RepID=UPI002ACE25B0|nr:molybdenum cofactor guanylyltransferase MobA [Rhodoferax sp.]MDZ7891449.1 molybdenum cofactor guanylyltransferase MobA [Rhodoferax sp.]